MSSLLHWLKRSRPTLRMNLWPYGPVPAAGRSLSPRLAICARCRKLHPFPGPSANVMPEMTPVRPLGRGLGQAAQWAAISHRKRNSGRWEGNVGCEQAPPAWKEKVCGV
jgi:hypothetical protein